MIRVFLLFALLLAPLFAQPAMASAEADCKHMTRILAVPDPVSGRRYVILVSLPDNFTTTPQVKRPVLVLADGTRAFPSLACKVRTLARRNAIGIDPVIVGLSYALGEDLQDSRRRDYTPVPRADSDLVYGGAEPYKKYLDEVVLRRVEKAFNTDPAQRIFWGHSYGALLGAYILLTQPSMFQTWLLGSPSFWYEEGAIYDFERTYALNNRRLDARVLMYVGGKEVARYDRARRGYTRDMVGGVRRFKNRLRARRYGGLTLKSYVLRGLDHRTAAIPGFEWAMQTAFPPGAKPAAVEKPTTENKSATGGIPVTDEKPTPGRFAPAEDTAPVGVNFPTGEK